MENHQVVYTGNPDRGEPAVDENLGIPVIRLFYQPIS